MRRNPAYYLNPLRRLWWRHVRPRRARALRDLRTLLALGQPRGLGPVFVRTPNDRAVAAIWQRLGYAQKWILTDTEYAEQCVLASEIVAEIIAEESA